MGRDIIALFKIKFSAKKILVRMYPTSILEIDSY